MKVFLLVVALFFLRVLATGYLFMVTVDIMYRDWTTKIPTIGFRSACSVALMLWATASVLTAKTSKD